MRLDKFIWAVRLAKTRSIAKELCDSGKVKINGEEQKPSKLVGPGDEVSIKVIPIRRTYSILDIPKSRVNAKLALLYIRETTSAEDLEQLENIQQLNRFNKKQGIKGRPTKKDRRDL